MTYGGRNAARAARKNAEKKKALAKERAAWELANRSRWEDIAAEKERDRILQKHAKPEDRLFSGRIVYIGGIPEQMRIQVACLEPFSNFPKLERKTFCAVLKGWECPRTGTRVRWFNWEPEGK